MAVVVGIPARMGASRFPGKPLAPILGMPMLHHVYRRACLASSVDSVFIAACDDEVRVSMESIGATVIMTDPDISRPSLRVAEACRLRGTPDDDIVVVVQGDEPLVHPEMVAEAVDALESDSDLQLGTLVADATESEWMDPDEVKVVTALNGDILFMSRSPIPSFTRGLLHTRLKQVAIMPFRADFLRKFQAMAPSPYEIVESIELLRALEHGIRVASVRTSHHNVSVDTPAGLKEAEAAMRTDPVYLEYAQS